MRTRFESSVSQAATAETVGRKLVRAGTVIYWLPCLCADGYLLLRMGLRIEGLGFVFQALMREAIVYMALWLVVGAGFTLLFSPWRSERKRRKRRRGSEPVANVALQREHRGI